MSAAVQDNNIKTPWQKCAEKFGGSQSELARSLGRHRSKISRVLKDKQGLISGPDQVLLLAAAKRCGVELSSDDLTPGA